VCYVYIYIPSFYKIQHFTQRYASKKLQILLLTKWFALYDSVFKDINLTNSVTLRNCFIIAFLGALLVCLIF
jgi:hypothetical protein